MRNRLFLLLGLLLLSSFGIPRSVEAAQLKPDSFALLVANNRGNKRDRPLRYAENDARKVRQTLVNLGGYKRKNIVFLQGRPAREVRKAFVRIQALVRKLKQQNRNATFLFYYSGHADNNALHLGHTRLTFKELRVLLRRSSAKVRLAILDTCRSGAMIRTKGAVRRNKQVPLPPVIRNLTTRGEAIITSSGVGEDSHELEQLRGSIFTHYLVSGLRGGADLNQDQKVSLIEAYNYAYQHTISHTVFLSSGVQHPSFRNALQGHGQLILTHLKQASARLVLDPGQRGTYYLLSRNKRRLVAEVTKKAGAPMVLGVAPGSYTLINRVPQTYRIQEVVLKKGQSVNVQNRSMSKLSYAAAASKGVSWLTHPHLPSKLKVTAYQRGFYSSLAVVAVGLAATGVSYGLAVKSQSDADAILNKTGNLADAKPYIQTAENWNVGAIAALSLGLAAGVTATVFYILHRQELLRPRRRVNPQSRTRLTPTNSRTRILVRLP